MFGVDHRHPLRPLNNFLYVVFLFVQPGKTHPFRAIHRIKLIKSIITTLYGQCRAFVCSTKSFGLHYRQCSRRPRRGKEGKERQRHQERGNWKAREDKEDGS
jgi:hypothetical protein